jgi:putative protease
VNSRAKAGEIIAIYTNGNINHGDEVYKSFDKEITDEGKRLVNQDSRRLTVKADVKAVAGEPMEIRLNLNEVKTVTHGPVVEAATGKPLDRDRILKQLGKTGSTSIVFDFESINIGENIFISISDINEMRRKALEEFLGLYTESFRREAPPVVHRGNTSEFRETEKIAVCAHVNTVEQLNAAFRGGADKVVINAYHMDSYKAKEILNNSKRPGDIILNLPKILRTYDERRLVSFLGDMEELDFGGYLISTYGELGIIKKYSTKSTVTDYNFNIFNAVSRDYLANMGLKVTMSTEMTAKEIGLVGPSSVIVYGDMELMLTHQCPIGLYAGENKSGKYCTKRYNTKGYTIKDKTGAEFPVFTDCDNCISFILNSAKLDVTEKLNIFDGTNVENIRLLFHGEEPREVFEAVSKCVGVLKGEYPEAGKDEGVNITYGHFFKGVL